MCSSIAMELWIFALKQLLQIGPKTILRYVKVELWLSRRQQGSVSRSSRAAQAICLSRFTDTPSRHSSAPAAAICRAVRNTRTKPSRALDCGPARGWRLPAFCDAIRGARTASISCPPPCPTARAGMRLGVTAGGAGRTRCRLRLSRRLRARFPLLYPCPNPLTHARSWE
jgi:hypothetical protein